MPIEYQETEAVFRGMVSVEEAEGLLDRLHERAGTRIDLAECTHLHPANLQVLMAAGCRIAAWPKDADLRAWLESVLKSV